MSFSVEVKTELCRVPLNRKCCAQAEAYGVLLYCNTFSASQARIVTENSAFAQRLPALFRKAFKLTFDRLPQGDGKQIFVVSNPDKLATIHHSVNREVLALMRELDQEPKSAQRKGNAVIYFKQSDKIEDFLTCIGAPVAAMEVMNAKLERDLRGKVNRRVNCDAANLDKAVEAAMSQVEAIRRLEAEGALATLPDKLQAV